MAKGWKLEPGRHALAAKGVSTKNIQKMHPSWFKHPTYPDELRIPDADLMKEFEGFDDLGDAEKYAKQTGGVLYTQVDTDPYVIGGERWDYAYLKGKHFVDRTGYYIVVKRDMKNVIPKKRKTKFYYKGEPVDIVNFGSDKQTVVVRPFDQSKNDILIWMDDLEER